MRDPMPTATQARIMLNMLTGQWPFARMSDVRARDRGAAMRQIVKRGWSINYSQALVCAGRDVLARYLYRTFSGPVVVVEWQPPMKPDEARVMLAIVTCREFKAPTELLGYLSLRRWVGLSRVSRGKLVATTSGREALISYLLRDFHA